MQGNINDAELQKFMELDGQMGVRVFMVHGDGWLPQVENEAALPSTGNTVGDIRQALDTGVPYRWNGTTWGAWSTPGASWGSIGGTLGSQTDLQNALNAKMGAGAYVLVSRDSSLANQIDLGALSTGLLKITTSGGVATFSIGAKGDIGLGDVDNTSDANKPVSTAQAAADTTVLNTAKAYAESLVVGLLDDRGNWDASSNTYPSSGGSGTGGAILKGDIWTVSVAGTLGTKAVTPGDVVRALTDSPAQTEGNWGITENNIGYVAENASNKATTMTGNTGDNTKYLSAKAVYDWANPLISEKQDALVSGTNIKTINSTSLLGSGNIAVEPVISAGTTAQYWRGDKSWQSLDKSAVGLGNVDNTSDENKPVSTAQAAADTSTLNAAKAYAESLVVGLLDDRGNWDASSNTYPSSGGSGTAGAILKGDLWTISVAGTLGGKAVSPGDSIRALVDTPGQTSSNWAQVENNFGFTPANDTAVVHLTGDETVAGVKTFSKIVSSNMDNASSGGAIRANGLDHVYYEWLVNLTRKAYVGFPEAASTVFQIVNEMTNGDINFQTNGTGKVKVNGTEIGTGGGVGTAKICYEGYLPGVQVVGSVWINVGGQAISSGSKFKIALQTLNTGASFIAELRKNGTAIATATIATGASATNGMYISDATTSAAIAENDKLEVYITQVGSSVSGNNFSFQLIAA